MNTRSTLFLILATLWEPAIACAEEVRRPNIVLIVADDLGYGDLGCYGQQLVATPSLDLLATEGMRFTQAYAGGPVCTASRCVLMTGMHTGHASARDNIPHYPSYLQDDDITVAEVLSGAGYRCGGVGKWSLGDAGTTGRATNQGFDSWLGYLNQDHAHYYFTEYLDDGDSRLDLTGNSTSRQHYSHDLLTERALQFIEESQAAPFFLYVAWTLPHFSSKTEDGDGLTVPDTEPFTDRPWDEKSKKYAAMVRRLDLDVGRIVDQIDQLGLGENTLILFTSDNGGPTSVPERFHTNRPLRGYKRDLTEGGLRVPFLARWTGTVPAAQINDQVIAFQDLLPTFAALANTQLPHDKLLDGIDIHQALYGSPIPPRTSPLYWDFGHCRGKSYCQAVRIGDWKGIRPASTGEIELYNLPTDIGETANRAAEFPKIVTQMREVMETAVTPNPRYPIGTEYHGKPIWRASTKPIVKVENPTESP